MSKYDESFKLSVVSYYNSGVGYKRTGQHFGLHYSIVRHWVRLYDKHGVSGLRRRSSKSTYSVAFKHCLIQQVQLGQSLTEVSITHNLPTPSLLSNWLKAYKDSGINGLKPKPRGRPINKKNVNHLDKADSEKSKEALLKELAYLRAENDYLKKLDALLREKAAKKKRSSSRS